MKYGEAHQKREQAIAHGRDRLGFVRHTLQLNGVDQQLLEAQEPFSTRESGME